MIIDFYDDDGDFISFVDSIFIFLDLFSFLFSLVFLPPPFANPFVLIGSETLAIYHSSTGILNSPLPFQSHAYKLSVDFKICHVYGNGITLLSQPLLQSVKVVFVFILDTNEGVRFVRTHRNGPVHAIPVPTCSGRHCAWMSVHTIPRAVGQAS